MHTALLPTALLAAAALALGLARPAGGVDDDPNVEPAPPTARPALTHVVSIGASVSAGYGNAAELRTLGDVPLSVFLRSTLADGAASSVRVSGDGDRWFFSNATKKGELLVDEALAESPTLVVAVDFLFWYAFGRVTRNDPRREAGLEKGLAQLDRIGCPIVIGDLPSIEHALDGEGPFGAPIVNESLFPTEDERARMNKTIRAWAERRGDVAIVPLAELTANMLEGRPIVVQGKTWTVTELSDALQADLLHPKVRGAIWISMMIADTATRLDGVTPDAFVWDEAVIRERIWDATEAARTAREEKERLRRKRRAERDRKRKERDQEPDRAPLSQR